MLEIWFLRRFDIQVLDEFAIHLNIRILKTCYDSNSSQYQKGLFAKNVYEYKMDKIQYKKYSFKE